MVLWSKSILTDSCDQLCDSTFDLEGGLFITAKHISDCVDAGAASLYSRVGQSFLSFHYFVIISMGVSQHLPFHSWARLSVNTALIMSSCCFLFWNKHSPMAPRYKLSSLQPVFGNIIM